MDAASAVEAQAMTALLERVSAPGRRRGAHHAVVPSVMVDNPRRATGYVSHDGRDFAPRVGTATAARRTSSETVR